MMSSAAKSMILLATLIALSGCAKLAERQAQKWVAGMMKDPDSAQFDAVKTIGEGRDMLACGKVNAKNGFGGYSGFRSFMVHDHNVYIASDELQDIHVRMCCNWLYDAARAGTKSVSSEEHQLKCGDIGDGTFLPID